jgi:energy-coupling factor transport system permease protein
VRPPVYRQTGSALHATRAGVAIVYVAAAATAAFVYEHPLVLGASLAGIVGAGLWAGVGREIARAARLGLPLALVVVLINPIVSQQGLTVLLLGPSVPVLGGLDVTLEALVYGAVAGLRVLVLVLAFGLYSAVVDPDEVLRIFRRVSLRSALTASLATRLVPLLARDAERLGAAYGLRASRPVTARSRRARLRRAAVLTRALAAGAMERSVDLAAALEVRAYSAAPRRASASEHQPCSRHDWWFALSAVFVLSLVLSARFAGVAGFRPYPLLQVAVGPADLALAAAIPAALVAPFLASSARRALLASDGAVRSSGGPLPETELSGV